MAVRKAQGFSCDICRESPKLSARIFLPRSSKFSLKIYPFFGTCMVGHWQSRVPCMSLGGGLFSLSFGYSILFYLVLSACFR